MDKQTTGFRFGRHRLRAGRTLGTVEHRGRAYRLVEVETEAGQPYLSLRLYNDRGKFIKQLLFEPELRLPLATLLRGGPAGRTVSVTPPNPPAGGPVPAPGYWENGTWTAWYETVPTPFGPLTRLVPGSLTRKAFPAKPEGSEPAPPTAGARPSPTEGDQ